MASVREQAKLAQAKRLLKGQKLKTRAPKVPKPFSTRNAERTYRVRLTEARERLLEAIRLTILPALESIGAAAVIRADRQLTLDAEPWVERVRQLMSDIRSSHGPQVAEYERLAQEAFSETSAKNLQSLRAQFREALGVDVFVNEPELQGVAESFIEENVGLIRNVDQEALSKVENTIFRGFRGGRRPEDLAQEIEHILGVSKSRANLIAIDQVQKINGQLTRNRQVKLGLDKYIWNTVLDERVRPAHQRRQGRIFSWDEPPPDGHPGEPINCRCFAEPYLEDVLGEESSAPNRRLPG